MAESMAVTASLPSTTVVLAPIPRTGRALYGHGASITAAYDRNMPHITVVITPTGCMTTPIGTFITTTDTKSGVTDTATTTGTVRNQRHTVKLSPESHAELDLLRQKIATIQQLQFWPYIRDMPRTSPAFRKMIAELKLRAPKEYQIERFDVAEDNESNATTGGLELEATLFPFPTMSQPRIAIIGAGPAGLALGALLQQQDISVTIFELRSKPTAKELGAPSGMLDLHEESGLAALAACGLMDDFGKIDTVCAESMIVMDRDGNKLHEDHGSAENRPEIARYALLSLLMSKVEPSSIRWEQKLISAEEQNDGTVSLHFQGSSSETHETFDLVIGADGAWSRIRPLLTAAKPEYSGLQYTTVTIREISTRFPELAVLVGTGVSFTLGGPDTAVLSHRGVDDTAGLYLTISHPTSENPFEGMTSSQIKDAFLGDRFAAWGPKTKALIEAGIGDEIRCGALVCKPMHRLPIGHAWQSKPCATLVGDAAHLMLPYAGEGVNLALWDALDLSKVIVKAVEDLQGGSFQERLKEPLAVFEKSMAARAAERAEETEQNRQTMFSEGGAQKMADVMKSYGPPPE
ncbi:hypothetical protein SBRCBS47491_006946 [Sporothrix bragantina]|uniref:FAD-binding domain-containing protein n=1 Tax=Sporothrix bragantina TaxID=671064 RepID=A0ABP0C954_9PEZI